MCECKHLLYRCMGDSCFLCTIGEVFGKLGWIIGKYRRVFLILPILISGALGGGLYFLPDSMSYNIEDQFFPRFSSASTERAFIKDHFPEGNEFSSLRLSTDGIFASLIVVNQTNILTQEALQEIINLDHRVKLIQTAENGLKFSDLCAKKNGQCVSNPILEIVISSVINGKTVGYPLHNGEFIGTAVGGVSKNPDNSIAAAQAIRLFYYLKEDGLRNETDLWLKMFLKNFSDYSISEPVAVSYFSSMSGNEEFRKSSEITVPHMTAVNLLKIFMGPLKSLWKKFVWHTIFEGIFAMITSNLAMLGSFGLLLYCGVPLVISEISPFIALGSSIENIMTLKWRQEYYRPNNSVKDRMTEIYEPISIVLIITTLIQPLSFYIGFMTPFGAIQSFCLYTGTAILFICIFKITFFGAFLAFNGKKEKSRHLCTCKKVNIMEKEEEEDGDVNKWTLLGWLSCTLLYFGYFASSIYGISQMNVGISIKNLAPDDSYVVSYYDNEEKYFKEYGPFVMLAIKDESFQYWNEKDLEILNVCLNKFESSNMVSQNMTVSWLKSYQSYGDTFKLNLTNRNIFMHELLPFLNMSGFSQDVDISDGKILTSRIFIPTVNVTTTADERETLNFFRQTACTCGEQVDFLVYHPAFIYFDQYSVTFCSTVQQIGVTSMVMFAISLLLIPNPLWSLMVVFSMNSVTLGVLGFMAFWDVNLNSISITSVAVCSAFSSDLAAQICVNPKAKKPVGDILFGMVTTILSSLPLLGAETYICRTFFKIILLVNLFNALHGILFIPIAQTIFRNCWAKK